MTRLMLLNGRCGEVVQLQIEAWQDAEKEGWIDKVKLNLSANSC